MDLSPEVQRLVQGAARIVGESSAVPQLGGPPINKNKRLCATCFYNPSKKQPGGPISQGKAICQEGPMTMSRYQKVEMVPQKVPNPETGVIEEILVPTPTLVTEPLAHVFPAGYACGRHLFDDEAEARGLSWERKMPAVQP